MRYWKGIAGTAKEGQCGTCDDNATVADSVECTVGEYNIFVTAQAQNAPPDYPAMWAAAATDSEKIIVIAKMMRLIS